MDGKDFPVEGECAFVLSGEFVLTKVKEGILFGRRGRAGSDRIGQFA